MYITVINNLLYMKEDKYKVIRKVTKLNEKTDWDIIRKLDKAISMAYDDRTFYIADIKLCSERNKGEIVLKTGWTRGTIKSRFSDKRNGYVGVDKVYKKYTLNPRLAEELNKYINKKFACGRNGAKYNFTGKTEIINRNEHPIDSIIKACEHFIHNNKYNYTGRGKVN